MKAFAVISRKSFLALILFLVLFALVLGRFYSVKARESINNGATNTDRLDFIYSLGVEVDSTPTTSKVIIPFEFSDVYVKYNNLQIEAGFNLEAYRGKEVCKYTYKVIDDEFTVVNLLVYNDLIIGGDICNIKINGFIKPLKILNNE